jgi:exodeoxyribonuclease VII small subunit
MRAILDLFPQWYQGFLGLRAASRMSTAAAPASSSHDANLTGHSPWAILPVPRPNARMSAKPAKSDPPESFEHALAELEKIVATMESGKLTLEQSLAAHKRGLELAQYCQGVLARAQQQVKVLEENTLKSLPGADDE